MYPIGAVLILLWLLNSEVFGDEVCLKEYDSLVTMTFTCSAQGGAQCRDGGFVMSGQSGQDGDREMWIMKISGSGDVEWSKTLKGNPGNANSGSAIVETNDDGFVVSGRIARSQYVGGFALAKYSANGVLRWVSMLHSSTGYGGGQDVKQTADRGFISTGNCLHDASESNALLAKYFENGTLNWALTISGSSTKDYGMHVVEVADGGGFVTTGSIGLDLYIAKFSSNGDFEWGTLLSGSVGSSQGSALKEVTDGYVVTGFTSSFGEGKPDLLLAKFTKEGELSWAKTYGDNTDDRGQSLQILGDGSILLTGVAGTTATHPVTSSVLLAKFTNDGDLLWGTKTITEGGRRDWGMYVSSDDENHVVLGWSHASTQALFVRYGVSGESCMVEGISRFMFESIQPTITAMPPSYVQKIQTSAQFITPTEDVSITMEQGILCECSTDSLNWDEKVPNPVDINCNEDGNGKICDTGSFVWNVTANSKCGAVAYEVKNATSTFAIDGRYGTLTTREEFEKGDEYYVLVEASDRVKTISRVVMTQCGDVGKVVGSIVVLALLLMLLLW